jgi:hypothetical protein
MSLRRLPGNGVREPFQLILRRCWRAMPGILVVRIEDTGISSGANVRGQREKATGVGPVEAGRI